MSIYKLVLGALSMGLFLTQALAQDIGKVKTLKGTAWIERGSARTAVTIGSALQAKDRVVTDANSTAGLTLRDNTLITVGPGSILEMNRYAFDATSHQGELDASVKRGSILAISGKIAKASPESVKFNTATVTLGVRGTEFILEAGEDTKYLGMWTDASGKMIQSGAGSMVASGNAAVVVKPTIALLLPAPDRKVGAIALTSTSTAQTQVLSSAYAALDVQSSGAMSTRQEDAASVQAQYGALLQATPKRPESFVIYFDTNSSTQATPASMAVIHSLMTTVSAWPAVEINIIGHTDTVGSQDVNDRLGLERARVVAALLQSSGLAGMQLEATSRGERELLVPTGDNVANEQNRRVEINLR
jgi:outer membrane protein OmpA-like peptidoglycan-associated protein